MLDTLGWEVHPGMMGLLQFCLGLAVARRGGPAVMPADTHRESAEKMERQACSSWGQAAAEWTGLWDIILEACCSQYFMTCGVGEECKPSYYMRASANDEAACRKASGSVATVRSQTSHARTVSASLTKLHRAQTAIMSFSSITQWE